MTNDIALPTDWEPEKLLSATYQEGAKSGDLTLELSGNTTGADHFGVRLGPFVRVPERSNLSISGELRGTGENVKDVYLAIREWDFDGNLKFQTHVYCSLDGRRTRKTAVLSTRTSEVLLEPLLLVSATGDGPPTAKIEIFDLKIGELT